MSRVYHVLETSKETEVLLFCCIQQPFDYFRIAENRMLNVRIPLNFRKDTEEESAARF